MGPSGGEANNESNKCSAEDKIGAASSQGTNCATISTLSVQDAPNGSAGGNEGDGEEPHKHRSVNLKRR